jgi:hypothetical protein
LLRVLTGKIVLLPKLPGKMQRGYVAKPQVKNAGLGLKR